MSEIDAILSTQGVTWKMLNQKHDCYDAERIHKLNLLLHGDADKEPQHWMRKLNGEKPTVYKDRLAFATYENNFGAITNDYASTLFSKPLKVCPATDDDNKKTPGAPVDDSNTPYMQWQQKFTLDGQSMPDFLKTIQIESNAVSTAYFGIDFKAGTTEPYAYYIDPCSVLDWEKDDEGNFIFLSMRNDECIRTSVRDLRDEMTTTFTIWTKTDKVKLEFYQVKYPIEDGKPEYPNDNDLIKKIQSPSDVSFKKVPIIDCITPDNISIGKLIGDAAGSLFARFSTYLFCLNRGINPLLVYKQGAELPADDSLSIINEDEDRGETVVRKAPVEGTAVIGPEDEISWVSPDKAAFTVVQEQLQMDKNELYRLCSSLSSIIGKAGVSSSQTKASGIAKMIDNQAKEHMLESYAKIVKEWALRAFRIAFESIIQPAGKETKEYVWITKGMDDFVIADQDQLLAKIEKLPEYRANMPSETSYIEYLKDIAADVHAFSNIGVMDVIYEEIENNVKKQDLSDLHQSNNPAGTMEADSAKQLAKAAPQDKGAKTAKKSSSNSSDLQEKVVGESGNVAAPAGSHLQSGSNVEWQTVYDTIKNDYKEKDLAFIKLMSWVGPIEVDENDIDMSKEANWAANKPGKDGLDKVEKYTKIMESQGPEAFNPVVLTNTPHNDEKLAVVDGRHRIKAAQAAGEPIIAYIGSTGSNDADMPHMQLHSKQIKGDS